MNSSAYFFGCVHGEAKTDDIQQTRSTYYQCRFWGCHHQVPVPLRCRTVPPTPVVVVLLE